MSIRLTQINPTNPGVNQLDLNCILWECYLYEVHTNMNLTMSEQYREGCT